MFAEVKPTRNWSDIGLRLLIASIVGVVVLTVIDGVLRGARYEHSDDVKFWAMIEAWIADFRSLFAQGIYAATIFFVGSKFFETRTILTIGFDKLDQDKITVTGPDENNTVWIGHRYNTALEAEAIADSFRSRLKG